MTNRQIAIQLANEFRESHYRNEYIEIIVINLLSERLPRKTIKSAMQIIELVKNNLTFGGMYYE